jgi:polyphosphate kinase 2 (PPK2 family)
MQNHRFNAKKFFVEGNSKIKLGKIATQSGNELAGKSQGAEALEADIESLQSAQERLYASNQRSLLVILQGMDTAGKDGIIRHVLHGVSPMGCRVHSFRAPNTEELEHHFLWRPMRFLPPKGMIAIFNRSYYEEVLVVRVHPKFLGPQNLLPYKSLGDLWERRYERPEILSAHLPQRAAKTAARTIAGAEQALEIQPRRSRRARALAAIHRSIRRRSHQHVDSRSSVVCDPRR